MKKVLLIIFFAAQVSFAQIGYVRYDHQIYPFLERMDALNILQDYDPYEIPKSRTEIAEYLKYLNDTIEILDVSDRELLNRFNIEFEIDFKGTTEEYSSLFPDADFSYLSSNNQKYLYFYSDPGKFNFFINFIGRFEQLSQRRSSDGSMNSTIIRYGGRLEGSLYDRFGFSISAQNGTFFGDKSLALSYDDLRYNFKFNLDNAYYSATNYFDNTEGYLLADFRFLKLKIGRDRQLIGYGPNKYIMSGNPPLMDYFSLTLNYKFFNFSFIHGKLYGSHSDLEDSLAGSLRTIEDKYLAYHRFGFKLGARWFLGLGEFTVYGDRNIDLSYVNPFNFFKTVEHANRDRDNSFLFFDLTYKPIDGLKISGSWVIDDLLVEKIGTPHIGNKFIYNLNLYSANLYKIVPVEFNFQYLRIDPYAYSHRLERNKYTSLEYPIANNLQPNSDIFSISANYRLNYRLSFKTIFEYIRHGANLYDSGGNLLVNYGGNINEGQRVIDSPDVPFLSGLREHSRRFSFIILYEPITNYYAELSLKYLNGKLFNSLFQDEWNGRFSFSIKI